MNIKSQFFKRYYWINWFIYSFSMYQIYTFLPTQPYFLILKWIFFHWTDIGILQEEGFSETAA